MRLTSADRDLFLRVLSSRSAGVLTVNIPSTPAAPVEANNSKEPAGIS